MSQFGAEAFRRAFIKGLDKRIETKEHLPDIAPHERECRFCGDEFEAAGKRDYCGSTECQENRRKVRLEAKREQERKKRLAGKRAYNSQRRKAQYRASKAAGTLKVYYDPIRRRERYLEKRQGG